MRNPDAIVIGAGPNGLSAAIALARAGRSVLVLEANETVGGGARSAETTAPGFVHDLCSAVHPLGAASPWFRQLPLAQHGLEWIEPPAALAHPFDDGGAVIVERSITETARGLGTDAGAYRDLMTPLAGNWERLFPALLGPFRWPRDPLALTRFGLLGLRSAAGLAASRFRGERARGLFAGMAAHSILPLEKPLTAAFGLVLSLAAHTAGWPFPRGGAQKIADALASYLRSQGGEIVTGAPVRSIDELPPARAVLCDLTPRPLLSIAGRRFPAWYRKKLESYRYGPGAFKADWALDGPIPWRASECARAGAVHLGGSLEEIARSERQSWEGSPSERPFVLLAQLSLFDPTRAPSGMHTAWAYCHTPNGSNSDMLESIENQIERFAPGFRRRVLARAVTPPDELERRNPNLVGGDIAGGVSDLSQFFTRPTWRTYSTPVPGVYICSSATPPGGGVHGMCGYFAAQRALSEVLRD